MSVNTTIGIKRPTLEKLHNLKFDLRVDSFEEVILVLVEEHEKAHCVEAPA